MLEQREIKMKITKRELRQIIKEEKAKLLKEANALEDAFVRDYHKSLGVDMTNYGRPGWWTRNQFAGETPDFFELGQRRFPEMSIQQPTSGAKLLAAMYGQKPPVEEYKLQIDKLRKLVDDCAGSNL